MPATGSPTAKTQLSTFIARFTPEIASLTRAALARMRERLPGAIEMVYDNTYALVVGFGATERPSEAVFSVVSYPKHVSLCFLQGASLPDPEKILKGSGNVVRHIRLEDAAVLDRPAVRTLMEKAIEQSETPFQGKRGRVVIRAIAAKRRPRRP
jgi:hypothetical protein